MSVVWRAQRALLREPFATDVDALLAGDRARWVVVYTFRTREEQAELYRRFLAGGPRAAPPGQSAHECGLAVDVALVIGDATIWDYTHADWRRLIALVKAHPRLHSLESIGDVDHIEAVQWRKLRG